MKNLILQVKKTYRAVPCGHPQTNFVGAYWLSSPNPTNAMDRLPERNDEFLALGKRSQCLACLGVADLPAERGDGGAEAV